MTTLPFYFIEIQVICPWKQQTSSILTELYAQSQITCISIYLFSCKFGVLRFALETTPEIVCFCSVLHNRHGEARNPLLPLKPLQLSTENERLSEIFVH